MNMNGGQDWDQVVLKKKKPTNSQLKDETAVNAVSAWMSSEAGFTTSSWVLGAYVSSFRALQARRQGVAVETVKKGKVATAGQSM